VKTQLGSEDMNGEKGEESEGAFIDSDNLRDRVCIQEKSLSFSPGDLIWQLGLIK
jgi:hypothetical protein